MRHKHADLIHAWAEGAEIEYLDKYYAKWLSLKDCDSVTWANSYEYRIKPEKKPDVVQMFYIDKYNADKLQQCQRTDKCPDEHDLKLTFCGETGKLIKAEVIE